MVRKPKSVWPGLIKDGKYRYSIAGDGNCLFASLSDQLYGDPARHREVRSKIIEHMRNFRPLFEEYVHKDDVHQRRTTRSAASAPAQENQDAFEEYLTLMSRPGTYGGEPELVAFCQVFDQDVTVHLPKIRNFDQESIPYTNVYRDKKPPPSSLHIAYGGEDQGASGHYDSARSRDGSHPPNGQPSTAQAWEVQTGPAPTSEVEAVSTSNVAAASTEVINTVTPTARAIRSGRSDLSQELIHDIIQKSKKEVEGSLDQLDPRARSTSVSSSHRSSSSKRSLEDEGDNPRRKRADRRKSTRRRTDMSTVSYEYDDDQDQADSPTNTPASTQDTETSQEQSGTDEAEYQPGQVSDSDTARIRKRKIIKPSSRAPLVKDGMAAQPNHPIKIAERPRPTLRT